MMLAVVSSASGCVCSGYSMIVVVAIEVVVLEVVLW
jgi:hypothetical protein